jgi:DNA-binding XRE family transcriptional regulator
MGVLVGGQCISLYMHLFSGRRINVPNTAVALKLARALETTVEDLFNSREIHLRVSRVRPGRRQQADAKEEMSSHRSLAARGMRTFALSSMLAPWAAGGGRSRRQGGFFAGDPAPWEVVRSKVRRRCRIEP